MSGGLEGECRRAACDWLTVEWSRLKSGCGPVDESLGRTIAALIRAKVEEERERCARIVDAAAQDYRPQSPTIAALFDLASALRSGKGG